MLGSTWSAMLVWHAPVVVNTSGQKRPQTKMMEIFHFFLSIFHHFSPIPFVHPLGGHVQEVKFQTQTYGQFCWLFFFLMKQKNIFDFFCIFCRKISSLVGNISTIFCSSYGGVLFGPFEPFFGHFGLFGQVFLAFF